MSSLIEALGGVVSSRASEGDAIVRNRCSKISNKLPSTAIYKDRLGKQTQATITLCIRTIEACTAVDWPHLPQTNSHQLPRLQLALHPPRPKIPLASAALVHGEVGGDSLCDIHPCPDAHDAHRCRVGRDGKGTHAAQNRGHLLLPLGWRGGCKSISGNSSSCNLHVDCLV